MKTILLSILFLGVLASCAHHRDVRPGSGGLHSVAVMSETKEKGARNAISQANHFCKERGKYATIEKEEATYVGSMSEEDYNKAKTAAKVTKGVGTAAVVFGGKSEKNLGGIAAIGGNIADKAIGKGYQTRMSFRCQ